MTDLPGSPSRRNGFVTIVSAEEWGPVYLPVELVRAEHRVLAAPPAVGWLGSMDKVIRLRQELDSLATQVDDEHRSVVEQAVELVDYSIESDRAFIAVFRADCACPEEPKAFFLFGEGGLEVEPDMTGAAAYMEAVDVENGVWDAVFDETGRCYRFWAEGRTTHMEPTDRVDLQALRDLLRARDYGRIHGADADDPLSVAVAISGWEWENRWPRRPRWLSRRLHGAEPRITP